MFLKMKLTCKIIIFALCCFVALFDIIQASISSCPSKFNCNICKSYPDCTRCGLLNLICATSNDVLLHNSSISQQEETW